MAKKKEEPNKSEEELTAQGEQETGDSQVQDPAASAETDPGETTDVSTQTDDRVSREELNKTLRENDYLRGQLSTVQEKPQETSLSGYSKKELFQLKQQHPQHQAAIEEELDQRNRKEMDSITDTKVQMKLNELAVYGLHKDFQDPSSGLSQRFRSNLGASPYLKDHADGILYAAKTAMLDAGIVDANKSKAAGRKEMMNQLETKTGQTIIKGSGGHGKVSEGPDYWAMTPDEFDRVRTEVKHKGG